MTKFMGLVLVLTSTNSFSEDCVVLLHGLASHEVMLKPMEVALDLQPELRTENRSYNSYSDDIRALAQKEIPLALEACQINEGERVHFVTHSMGGLLLRAYLTEAVIPDLGKIVMIAPPNQGSEIVDFLNQYTWLAEILGPAGKQLSTDNTGIPQQIKLSTIEAEIGIIAGNNQSTGLFRKLIPGQDDGKVSTERAKLEYMTDFIILDASHSGLLMQKQTIEQTLSFLRYGKFRVDQLPEQASK